MDRAQLQMIIWNAQTKQRATLIKLKASSFDARAWYLAFPKSLLVILQEMARSTLV